MQEPAVRMAVCNAAIRVTPWRMIVTSRAQSASGAAIWKLSETRIRMRIGAKPYSPPTAGWSRRR
jgi:hypothetical protein